MEGNEALIRQFLEYLLEKPRSYAGAQEAWRTSCPRLSIWEDALAQGLAERISGPNGTTLLRVSERGTAWLSGR